MGCVLLLLVLALGSHSLPLAFALIIFCLIAANRKIKVPVTRQAKNKPPAEGSATSFGPNELLRQIRVGAMNIEHREILAVIDRRAWNSLSNGARQTLASTLRSTWAQHVCPDGTDVAYVTLQTDDGTIVARAGPHSISIS